MGGQCAQPRAELRPQPADGSGLRLHHANGDCRHGQDLDDAGGRAEPGAGRAPLHRDHRDPRDGAGGRGHRLPARHRGREDEPLDGGPGRQPGGAGAQRWLRWRLGPGRHQ